MDKVFVTKSSLPDYEEYCKQIKCIWDNNWLTNNGALHNELESKIKEYLHVSNVSLFVNGHLALENAIKVLDLKGEVITTPFTFISTTHAITRNGLTPVFCDINYDDYTMDTSKIEELITDKTCAIIPVHVYGNVCNVEEIERIAKKHNLKVIYDAAHAFGVEYKNKSIASYGDISMFSFHATKVFNTIEGGALAYSDDSLWFKLKHLKNFGIEDAETILCVGGNAKMNEFQAAMGLCNLKNLENNVLKRKEIVLKYRELLKDTKGIKLCPIQDDVKSNYAYFPIVILDEYGLSRDELYDLLEESDICTRKYFYPISNQLDMYKDCKGDTPIAKDIANRVLTLPLYPDLDIMIVEKICKIINDKK